MTDPVLLPELSEADSRGEVGILYTEIRRTLGVPFVGLVYRTLAVEPGRLAAAWARLGPLLAHPIARRAASEMDAGLAEAPPILRLDSGYERAADLLFERRAAATLAAYDQMNRLNLLGLSALLRQRGESAPGPPIEPNHPPPETRWVRDDLLPMPALDSLPAEDRDLLLGISRALLGQADQALVPSLLRHFALPGLLAPLWRSIQPAVESGFVAGAAAGLRRQALALPLPPGVIIAPAQDPAIAAVAASFVVATSTMVVTGALLERALAP